MLQQTRIAAVLPYYRRFLRRFPTLWKLTRAPEREVLKHWAGLGYYSRARNLRRAAKEIIARHGGKFPRTVEAARELPGVGCYTASAVLSIAYDVPLAVLDGNVARVLARLRAMRGDLREPHRWRSLAQQAQSLLAREAPGDWNQAMMELGETVCTPQEPRCGVCPISRWCRAYKLGIAGDLPSPRRKRATMKQRIAAAVLLDGRGRTLLVKDAGKHDGVLFSRMWQFPAIEVRRDPAGELARYLNADFGIRISEFAALAPARHAVTFRNITLLPFLARVERLPEDSRFHAIPLDGLARVPVSSATRKIAAAALLSSAGACSRLLRAAASRRTPYDPERHKPLPLSD
jgi:A/G-specific adenine glycosylase